MKQDTNGRANHKQDAKGRSTTEPKNNAKLKTGALECYGKGKWWGHMSTEMKSSPAIRALSLNAHRALLRITIEHENHGLQENGKLIVTYDDFVEYGIRRERIKPALDQLKFFGLIRIKRGRAGDGTSHPNNYRLTWIGDCEHNSPTHEWKATDEAKIKSWEKKRARKKASQGQKPW